MNALSGCDWNIDFLCCFLECREIFWRHRLLDPGWVKSLKLVSHLHSSGGVETPVHLNQYFNIGANCIVYRFNKLDHLIFLSTVEFVEACTEGVKLESAIAFLKCAFGGCVELLGGSLDGVPAIGVCFNPISNSTT